MLVRVTRIICKNREDRILVPSSVALLLPLRHRYFYFDSARQKDSGNKIGHVPTQHTALWNLVPLLCEAASIQNDFHVIVCFNCLLYLFVFGET